MLVMVGTNVFKYFNIILYAKNVTQINLIVKCC